MLPGDTAAGQNATEGIRHISYSEVVIEGVRRRAREFVEDSIVRKTDRALNKGDHREGGTIEGPGKGGSILVHVGTDNAEREGTTATVGK